MTARRLSTLVLIAVVAAMLVPMPAGAGPAPEAIHPWIAEAESPEAVAATLARHSDKVPVEFYERLEWASSDGILRVIVALDRRDEAVEAFVRGATTWVRWYGDSPRFYAGVTADQLQALLAAAAVSFVEPDYPVTNFTSTSTLDVHARSLGGDGTGVWSFDPNAGARGALGSDVAGLSVDQATGKGVTVAITDSGIDKTHRDFGGFDCEPGPYQPCESRIRKTITIDQIIDTGADPGDALPTSEAASGHGTHVAGTIAGNGFYTRDGDSDAERYEGDGYVFGVAPQASLVSVKNGDSQWAGLSQFALEWQLAHADEFGIRVSSNSWGCLGGCSFNGNSASAQLYKDLYEAGVVVVFAAGNDGGGQDGAAFSGDAQSPYVLAVAAYDDSNHQLANFSSRGSDNSLPAASTWTPESEAPNGERRPDVAAPGVSIWAARTLTGGTSSGVPRANANDIIGGGSNGFVPYVTMSGTSMAAPHVSGTSALLFSACPAAEPLHVMRAVMAGANRTEVLKTSGSGTAEPFEAGFGALEARASLDWLRNDPVCGGSGNPDPDPDPTVDPTPDPTNTVEPGSPQTFYFHANAAPENHADFAAGGARFDTQAPTGDTALAVQPWGIRALWFGQISEPIQSLTVDLYQASPEDRVGGTASYDTVMFVDDGTANTQFDFPSFTEEVSGQGEFVRVQHTFTTMLDAGGNEVPLNIDPRDAEITFGIAGTFIDAQAVSAVAYGSEEFPSGFSINGGSDVNLPAPTSLSFTDASASEAQYSDNADVLARLTDDAGAPIEGATVVFELVGEAGSRTWEATTGADGVAGGTQSFVDEPGSYQLNARFEGIAEEFEPSADTASFVVTPDDSVTVLEVTGKGQNRDLTARTSDADSSAGLEGRSISFFADGTPIGQATTNSDGVATLAAPPGYRGDSFDFEAVFDGDEFYLGSRDNQRT